MKQLQTDAQKKSPDFPMKNNSKKEEIVALFSST
jgi:hypothetical protein